MEKWRKFFEEERKNYWLIIILALAFFLRIIGIQYGLPFRISLDELGPVYGALKMIELKTLIPSLHPEVFNYILQYPPYMSYIYIPFFIFLGGIKFIQFLLLGGGFRDIGMFKLFLVSDPSVFFVVARTISAIFGLATVFLVYKISKNIFKNEKIALFSMTFLAFSFLHVSLSHASRHWIYVVFLFSLIIYALSRFDYSIPKKYTLAFALAGLGMGLNYQIGIAVFFIALWFLFFDKISFIKSLKETWIYKALGLFLFLSALAIALHLHTTGLADQTLGKDWGLIGLLKTYGFYISQMFSVEFIFLFFVIIGFLVSLFKNRDFFLVSFIFSLIYIMFFYFVYHTHDSGRYLLMLYPIFAISAGYGLYFLSKKSLEAVPKNFVYGFVLFLFLAMFFISLKFDYLLAKKDTRVQALEWIEKMLPTNAKIIVFVPFMRLPSTPLALAEQEKIDPSSVSQIDKADSILPQKFYPFQKYYSISLYKIKNQSLKDDIQNYTKSNQFGYLVYAEDFNLMKSEGMLNLLDINGQTIKVIKGFSGTEGDVNIDFAGGLIHILNSDNNGPTMIIKKIYQ